MNTKFQTECCPVCLQKDETIIGGHVHKGSEILYATPCAYHHNNGGKSCDTHQDGCYGEWNEKMGMTQFLSLQPEREKISKLELAKLLHLRDANMRSVDMNVTKGNLPVPIEENGEQFFFKDEVIKMLGVPNLDEPFIDAEQAGKILGLTPVRVKTKALEGWLPSYRLGNSKGCKILFIESELRSVYEGYIKMEWNSAFNKMWGKLYFLQTIALSIANSPIHKEIFTNREAEIFTDMVLEGKTVYDCETKYDLTKERVRQILERAMRRLCVYISQTKTVLEQLNHLKVENRQLSFENEYLKVTVKKLEGMVSHTENFQDYLENKGDILEKKISECDLSVRAIHCLQYADIVTVKDLCAFGLKDLTKLRNMGRKTIGEITAFLYENKLFINE